MNRFAAAHGDYRHETLPVTSGELGEAKHGQVRVLRNRGGTTVERWLAADALTSGQAEAISLYARAWHMFIGEQRITANWSLTATIRGMSAESWLTSQLEAKEFILLIDEHVFKFMPTKYVDVWKNVVIFDRAAVAEGALLGYGKRTADAKVKTICLFIADMIAHKMRLGVPQ